jgi:nitrogen fixation protein NifU and related proteins
MSDELRELYQEVILDHSKRPRNFGKLEASQHADGHNPLCGDRLTVYLRVENGVVSDARFRGEGCAISTASASLMTEAVRGLTPEQARALFQQFHGAVTAPADAPVDVDALGKLAVLTGVRRYPMRVKCASLAWHTLDAALRGKADPVTTE